MKLRPCAAKYAYTCYKCGTMFGSDARFDPPESAYCLVGCAVPPMEARKDDDGKLRYDLIPVYPLEEVARVYTLGAKKYADHNWRKGIAWSRIYGAMQRHANAYWQGESNDPEDGQKHLASVVWTAFTLMEYEKFKLGEDDRWKYSSPS